MEKEQNNMEKVKNNKPKRKTSSKKVVTNVVIALLVVFMIATAGFSYVVHRDNTIRNAKLTTYVNTPVTEAVEKVKNSVVGIYNKASDGNEYIGSGFIYKISGNDVYMLTNYHVTENNDKLGVYFEDSHAGEATFVGGDPNYDLAVIKAKREIFPEDIKALTFGDSQKIVKGDTVIVLGTPLDPTFYNTTTVGVVSDPTRFMLEGTSTDNMPYYNEFIQIDAAINHGNSGGPLFDINGNVIGVNSRGISADENADPVANFGFSIPQKTISEVLPYIESGKTKPVCILGLAINSFYTNDWQSIVDKSDQKGLYVLDMLDNTPASRAGIAKGDLITSFDGKEVTSTEQINDILLKTKSATSIPMTVIRSGVEKTLTINLDTFAN